MGVIWKNTLKVLNHGDAEKVLAYASEHYKERGLEDYDEQTMGGLEFDEYGLIYTEVCEDRLKVFYKFVDEIAAALPEVELSLSQVGDDHIVAKFIYKNGLSTRYVPRRLELLAADKEDSIKLIEVSVPIIEAAGFRAKVDSEQYSVSFECDAKSCSEFKESLAEQIAKLMPESKILCVILDLDALEFDIVEYCILDGQKGTWDAADSVMFHLALTFNSDGKPRFSTYDVLVNTVKCFIELQTELRSGKYSNSFEALNMIFSESPYHNQLIDLLTPEDKDWLMDEGRISRDIDQVRSSLWIESSDVEIEITLNDIYAKCNLDEQQ